MLSCVNLRLPGAELSELTRELRPAPRSAARASRRVVPLLWVGAAGLALVLLGSHAHPFVHALRSALHASWQLVVAAVVFEAASVAGYVVLFHRVVARANAGLRLKDSYDITLAGTAATRLLPTAGLGGAAVSVWALRARGLSARHITERLLAFLLLLYGVYMAAMFAAGAAIGLGLVHVSHGSALGVLGAGLASVIAGAVIYVCAAPAAAGRLLGALSRRRGRMATIASGAREQLPLLRRALARGAGELRRPHLALLGAVAWWGFDVAVLGTMLHAFGASMPIAAVVLTYFLGTMFNVVPLPGSLSGGLVGVSIALGAAPTAAVAAVLAYRMLAVWLPAASGLVAIARLRASVTRWRSEPAVTDPQLGKMVTQWAPLS